MVSPGEVVAVTGGNGAGKTTLLKVLATLAAPLSGKVFIEGMDALANPVRYRRLLGYMPEGAPLCEEMTVKGYLKYRGSLKGEPERRLRRRMAESVAICRLEGFENARIASLSAGMKRRVALADAILARPKIVLLDDFPSGFDREMRESAGAALSAISAFAAVVATGHEIADYARWATRILVLRGGVVAATVPAAGAPKDETVARVDAALAGGVQ